jgi:hypothetical protein
MVMKMTESKPKPPANGVSRKMLVVIVAMLAVILVPVAVSSIPTCKLVIKATNTDTEDEVTCYLMSIGGDYGSNFISIDPGEEHVWTYHLMPGSYYVNIDYWFEDANYSGRSFSETVTLFLFETETVKAELGKWS